MDDDFIILGDQQGRDVAIHSYTPVPFYRPDRRRHLYAIGQTGTGKSTLLENTARQDIRNGEGLTVIDPNGDLIDSLVDCIPPNRANDVLLFDPGGDPDYPVSFNFLVDPGIEFRHLAISSASQAFSTIWELSKQTARLHYILNNALAALIEAPNTSLRDMKRLLTDDIYRDNLVYTHVTDYDVKQFWFSEFPSWSKTYRQDGVAALQNKLGQFFMSSMMKNVFSQTRDVFDPRSLLDERKIVLVRLSKGRMGKDNAYLVGTLFVTKMALAAFSRDDIEEKHRIDHYLHVDEFQNMATDAFEDICSEARKYRLCLALYHQYIEQLSPEIKRAIFGNVQSIVSFAVGGGDAEELEKQFGSGVTKKQIMDVENYHAYARIRRKEDRGQVFKLRTNLPSKRLCGKRYRRRDLVVERSRQNYATPRDKVEAHLRLHEKAIDIPEGIDLDKLL